MSEPIINIINGEDVPSDFTNISGKDTTSNKMKTQAALEMHQQAAAHLRAADHLLSAAAQHSSSVGPAPDLSSAMPGLWISMEEEEDFSEERNLLPKYKMINTGRKDNSCDSCCENLIKYVLVLFNVVFAAIGLAIVYLGVYFKINYRSEYYMDFMGVGEYWQWFNIPIIAGLVIFVVAVCGFIGAFLKHPFLLYIHTVLHFAIIIVELGILLNVAYLAIVSSEIGLKIGKDVIIKSSMEFYSDCCIIGASTSWIWDLMQRSLECCGWDRPSDWTNTTYGQIPCSCCAEEQVLNCRNDLKVDFFSQGCNEVLREKYWENPDSQTDIVWIVFTIIIIIPSFALFQLIMILCSCCNAGTKMYLLDRERRFNVKKISMSAKNKIF